MITVYTAILCGYDNLRPPGVIEPGVRYVCFSDEPLHCPPWEIQPAWLRYDSGSRNSRIPKILSHLHIDTEYSIYHDGCLSIQCKPSSLIAEVLKDADWAMYSHPCRKSVYEELNACRSMGIGYGSDMQEQVDRYRANGLGDGLWAGGVIVRKKTDLTVTVNEAWWREYINGCARDQISFPFVRQAYGLRVHSIDDADILQDTKRFGFNWHGWAEQKGDNPSFATGRQRRAERWKRLKELCA